MSIFLHFRPPLLISGLFKPQAAIQKLLCSQQLRRRWGLSSLRRGCDALRLLRARWLEAACMAMEGRHAQPLIAWQLGGRDATARYQAFAARIEMIIGLSFSGLSP